MPSTRITRLRDLQVEDRSALDSLIDGTLVGHVGLVVDDGPVVVPTAVARENDSLLVHGSTGSRWMRALARGTPACVAVTALDGVIVARSTFESSMRYRSAVLYGRFDRLGGAPKERALGVIVDKLIPGRAAEVRPSTAAELNRTMVLSMPITTWSLKVSDGWPEDSQPDVEGPAWAGVVPLTLRALPPQPAPDLRSGIPVPPSVAALGRTRDA